MATHFEMVEAIRVWLPNWLRDDEFQIVKGQLFFRERLPLTGFSFTEINAEDSHQWEVYFDNIYRSLYVGAYGHFDERLVALGLPPLDSEWGLASKGQWCADEDGIASLRLEGDRGREYTLAPPSVSREAVLPLTFNICE